MKFQIVIIHHDNTDKFQLIISNTDFRHVRTLPGNDISQLLNKLYKLHDKVFAWHDCGAMCFSVCHHTF